MKVVALTCLVIAACAYSNASAIPRSTNGRSIAKVKTEMPIDHWRIDNTAREVYGPLSVVKTRGGGDVQLTKKSLWAALGFHVVWTLLPVLSPESIGRNLMNSIAMDISTWTYQFLAACSLGSAVFTLLSIKDGSSNAVRIAAQSNMASIGACCILVGWQWSQAVFDNQNALIFVAITAVITGTLAKGVFF